jgi:hypothetical protein
LLSEGKRSSTQRGITGARTTSAGPGLTRLHVGDHLSHPPAFLGAAEALRKQHHDPVAVAVGRHRAPAPGAAPHLDLGCDLSRSIRARR